MEMGEEGGIEDVSVWSGRCHLLTVGYWESKRRGESRIPSNRLSARLGCQREADRQREGGVHIWKF